MTCDETTQYLLVWAGFILGFLLFPVCQKIYYKMVAKYQDPIDCEVYREEGCAHVDGPLCPYPSCEIRHSYLRSNCAVIPIIPKR